MGYNDLQIRGYALKLRFCICLLVSAVAVVAVSGYRRQGGQPSLNIVAMVEASGTTTYTNDTQHVMRITWQMPGSGGAPGGNTSTGGTTGTTGTTGNTYQTSTTSYTFSVDDPSCTSVSGYSASQALTDDTSSRAVGGPTQITDTSANPHVGFSVDGFSVNPGDKVTLRIAPTGRTVHAFLMTTITTYTYNSSTNQLISTAYSQSIARFDYAISRTATDATSIDSRAAFGQPNVAGVLPGDPNVAATANINFYQWVYKGGLFAGTSSFLNNNDLSGTARIEAYSSGLGSTPFVQPVFETLTMLAVGSPTQFSTPAVLSPAQVSSGSTSLSSATWANQWVMTVPGTSPPTVDFTLYAGYSGPEYANFQLGSYWGNQLGVQLTNEAAAISNGTGAWEYFADSAYITSLSSAGATLSGPLADALPRIWVADFVFNDAWQTLP